MIGSILFGLVILFNVALIQLYFSYICDGTWICRWTEEVGPTVGLPRHKHFVGFFNLPVQGQPFYGYSEKMPHFSRLLRRAQGYLGGGGAIL